MTALYKPWHMAHDTIVKAGAPAGITARFDYDAALHKDLEGERVHAYLFGTGMSGWQYVGSEVTDSDGKITLALGVRPVGEYIVRFVVEGDLSSTSGYLSVVDPGRDAVLFDIDGTLTVSDLEAYADDVGVRTATPYAHARRPTSGPAKTPGWPRPRPISSAPTPASPQPSRSAATMARTTAPW